MRRFRTLRVRFALWTAGLLFVMLAVFGAFVYFSLGQGLSTAVDTSLRLSASQVIAALNIENNQISFSDNIPDGAGVADLRERGFTIRVLDPAGKIVQSFGRFQALPVSGESLAGAQRQESTLATLPDPTHHDLVRIYTAPATNNGQLIAIVQVAQSLATLQDTLTGLLTALLIGGSLLIVLAAFGGYFLAARALAPIDHITRTAHRISAEDLSARLNLPATDDEVGRLASTFDAMLTRLDESFRRERRFTADASHELRTPLTAMQMILSVIRGGRRTPEDYDQALTDLSEEVDRQRSLVEDLLHLARGDAGREMSPKRVDMSALLRDITETMEPLAESKGLSLTCAIPDGLSLVGDSDSLVRLFANLLDNAVKYTEHGGVTVRAHLSGDLLRVDVSDTGVGIPPEHLAHVFDRFYRVESSRSSRGSGLGLAIALDIAHAHGGTIEVHSLAGEGTTFAALLPTSAPIRD